MSDPAHRPSYLTGLLTLAALAVLTWLELQIDGQQIFLLLAVGIAKAAIIVQMFMHISRLWSRTR